MAADREGDDRPLVHRLKAFSISGQPEAGFFLIRTGRAYIGL